MLHIQSQICQAYHPSQHVTSRPAAPRTLHLVATAPVNFRQEKRINQTNHSGYFFHKGSTHTWHISRILMTDWFYMRFRDALILECDASTLRLAGIASSSGSCGGWACNSRVAAFTLSGEMEFLWPLPARSVWWLLTILEWKPRQPQKIHITWWCLNAWGPVSPEMINDTSKGATTLKASEKHPNGSWKTLHGKLYSFWNMPPPKVLDGATNISKIMSTSWLVIRWFIS